MPYQFDPDVQQFIREKLRPHMSVDSANRAIEMAGAMAGHTLLDFLKIVHIEPSEYDNIKIGGDAEFQRVFRIGAKEAVEQYNKTIDDGLQKMGLK